MAPAHWFIVKESGLKSPPITDASFGGFELIRRGVPNWYLVGVKSKTDVVVSAPRYISRRVNTGIGKEIDSEVIGSGKDGVYVDLDRDPDIP